jgi:hypothetical protein
MATFDAEIRVVLKKVPVIVTMFPFVDKEQSFTLIGAASQPQNTAKKHNATATLEMFTVAFVYMLCCVHPQSFEWIPGRSAGYDLGVENMAESETH